VNTSTKSKRAEKLDALALDYEKRGFAIWKEPARDDLPFDLDGYTPDLVARNGDSGVIIEIKPSAGRLSIDRFQSIAQEIASHPGWRFILVTLDDVDSSTIPTTTAELPTWEQLMDKIGQVELMVNNRVLEPALLYLWSIFEAALRKRAIQQNIPIERLPPHVLLNHMYSQGEVSVYQLDTFRELLKKRDRIVHGANEPTELNVAAELLEAVKALVTEWCDAQSAVLSAPARSATTA
jgi:hypothetical protein